MKPPSSRSRVVLLGLSLSAALVACGGKSTPVESLASKLDQSPATLHEPEPAKLTPVIRCAS